MLLKIKKKFICFLLMSLFLYNYKLNNLINWVFLIKENNNNYEIIIYTFNKEIKLYK